MTELRHLVQKNIIGYESRMKHFDESMGRMHTGVVNGPGHVETRNAPANPERERDGFTVRPDEQPLKPLENRRVDKIQKAGAMGIRDAVGRQLGMRVGCVECRSGVVPFFEPGSGY